MGSSTSRDNNTLDNLALNTHKSIKELVPEYQTGDEGFDNLCLTDYCYGNMGTDWKDKYDKGNYIREWYTIRPRPDVKDLKCNIIVCRPRPKEE